jgi:hypothetical protein
MGELARASDLTDLWWASGGGLVAGSIAAMSDSGAIRMVFGLACLGLLSAAVFTGSRILRRQKRQRS